MKLQDGLTAAQRKQLDAIDIEELVTRMDDAGDFASELVDDSDLAMRDADDIVERLNAEDYLVRRAARTILGGH